MTSPAKARVVAAEKRVGKALVRAVGEHKIPYRIEELAVMARYVVREQLADWPPLPESEVDDELALGRRPLLAPSDRQLMGLLAAGLDNGEAAERLGVSERLVCTRLRRIFGLLGARNRTHAVALAYGAVAPAVDGVGAAGPGSGPVRSSAASELPMRGSGGRWASAARTEPPTASDPPGAPIVAPDGPSAPPNPAPASTATSSPENAPQTAVQAVRA